MKRVTVIALVVALVASAATVLAAERWLIAEWQEAAAAALEVLNSADAASEGLGAQEKPHASSSAMRETIAEQTVAMHDTLPSQMWGRVFPILFLYSALVLLAGCAWLSWWQKRVTER